MKRITKYVFCGVLAAAVLLCAADFAAAAADTIPVQEPHLSSHAADSAFRTVTAVAPAPDTNIIHELARLALHLFGVALVTIIGIYLPRIIRAIEAKLRIDVPDPLEAQAQRLALDGIAYAEEWARGKALALGKKVLSGDKLDAAATYFRDHASDQVLRWTGGKVKEWIETNLGHLRMLRPALAATNSAATATPDPSTPGAQ